MNKQAKKLILENSTRIDTRNHWYLVDNKYLAPFLGIPYFVFYKRRGKIIPLIPRLKVKFKTKYLDVPILGVHSMTIRQVYTDHKGYIVHIDVGDNIVKKVSVETTRRHILCWHDLSIIDPIEEEE